MTVDCACVGVRKCVNCLESNRVVGLRKLLPGGLEPEQEPRNFYVYDLTTRKVVRLPDHLSSLCAAFEDVYNRPGTSENADQLEIDGLEVVLDAFSESEEAEILSEVDSWPWKCSQSGRQKQDFGPQVNFKQRRVKLGAFRGLPTYTSLVEERINRFLPSCSSFVTVEVCALSYDPSLGASIDFHRDDDWLWGERLISVNLLSACVFTLFDAETRSIVYIAAPRRSIILLEKGARYRWQHGILAHHLPARRVALTLRELTPIFLEGGELFEEVGSKILSTSRLRVSPTTPASQ